MEPMKTVCVYCGSSPGRLEIYAQAAREMGRELARRKARLVYGGGSVGLMGILADAVLENGGEVTGVIPEALAARELAHHGLTELRVVPSMHERKALMADLSDAFIALPGGWGTFEEILETLTWAQLGIHGKPCGILNTLGYYDALLALLDHSVAEHFLRPEHRDMLLVDTDTGRLLDRLQAQHIPSVPKWMDSSGR